MADFRRIQILSDQRRRHICTLCGGEKKTRRASVCASCARKVPAIRKALLSIPTATINYRRAKFRPGDVAWVSNPRSPFYGDTVVVRRVIPGRVVKNVRGFSGSNVVEVLGFRVATVLYFKTGDLTHLETARTPRAIGAGDAGTG